MQLSKQPYLTLMQSSLSYPRMDLNPHSKKLNLLLWICKDSTVVLKSSRGHPLLTIWTRKVMEALMKIKLSSHPHKGREMLKEEQNLVKSLKALDRLNLKIKLRTKLVTNKSASLLRREQREMRRLLKQRRLLL